MRFSVSDATVRPIRLALGGRQWLVPVDIRRWRSLSLKTLLVVIVSGVPDRETYSLKNFSAIVMVEVSCIGIASDQREK